MEEDAEFQEFLFLSLPPLLSLCVNCRDFVLSGGGKGGGAKGGSGCLPQEEEEGMKRCCL